MTLVAEAFAVALVGAFPIWCFVGVRLADHVAARREQRDETPDQRALRVLREQADERRWWA